MNENPDEINNPDRQIAARVYNEAEAYAETRKVSKDLNEKRTKSRKNIVEMGFRKDAYQVAIRVVKDLTPREQKDFIRDLQTFLKILGGRQADLFPEEALKAAKREEKRKEKAAEDKARAGRSPDHPRSDPAAGGAGKPAAHPAAAKAKAKGKAKDAKPKPDLKVVGGNGTSADGDQMIKDVVARKEAERLEQEQGEKVLAGVGKPGDAPPAPDKLN